MKIYTSKSGLKFAISTSSKESEEDLVYFTAEEISWIKRQNLSSQAFEFIWKSKKEDYKYCPIPLEKEPHQELYKKPDPNELALKYCAEILNDLTGKGKKDDCITSNNDDVRETGKD